MNDEIGKYRSLMVPGDRINSFGLALEVVILTGLVGLCAFIGAWLGGVVT